MQGTDLYPPAGPMTWPLTLVLCRLHCFSFSNPSPGSWALQPNSLDFQWEYTKLQARNGEQGAKGEGVQGSPS